MSLAPRIDRFDRNYLINGNFSYWNRTTSSTSSGAYYTADRWKQAHSGGSLNTFSRVADAPTNRGSTYSLQYSLTPGGPTSIGDITQYIESTYAKTLAGKTISTRIWYKTLKATSLRIQFEVPTVADNYASTVTFHNATYTITNDGAWRYLDVENITVPSGATNGVSVFIRMTGWIDTSAGSTCNIADVCLVEGPNAQDFSYAGGCILSDGRLCNRYYKKYVNNNNVRLITGMATSTTNAAFALPLADFFRTHTTVMTQSTMQVTHSGGTSTASAISGEVGIDCAFFNVTVGAPAMTIGQAVQLVFSGSSSYIDFDGEI